MRGPTRRSARCAPWRALRWLLLLAWMALAPGLATQALAQAAQRADFDHLAAGFALSGAHGEARCESCHRNGVFRGTPRDCATCHTAGTPWSRANVVKDASHLPTQERCDSCHNTRRFEGARYSHANVTPGTCQSCHNGLNAPGKPAAHLATRASCDACHQTQAWSPAKGFDHGEVAPGTCVRCHGPGGQASQRPAAHIPVSASQSCDSCHRSFQAWRPSSFNHSQVPVAAQCASCHTGSYPPADGKSPRHIPYTAVAGVGNASCDACHKAGYGGWTPAAFHKSFSVSSQCATCHNGSYPPAEGKPATPVHAGVTQCESCHTTRGWSGATADHSKFNQSTNCASCHNGSTATGKPATHMPVGITNCIACHQVTGWKPTKWNHTQVVVTAQCASCHTGTYPPADGKPATHIPYALAPGVGSANCDACHRGSYASWAGARFHASFTVASGCSTCHTGGYLGAVGKPATPVHNGVSKCESCHGTSSWSGAKVDHSRFNTSTQCTGCHNGSTAPGKPATHIPVGSTNCVACHSVTAWKPTKWNHTQVVVTAQCASCHTGGYPPADGKPATHIPYALVTVSASANCDACHKSGYASWNPGRFHTYFTTSNQCATCHTGAYLGAVGKPADSLHAGATQCESCHKSTRSWQNVQFQHGPGNQVGSGTCDGCHNGTVAQGKPSDHVPILVGTTKCDSCHRSQADWATAVTTNHALVAGQACKSCHVPTYTSQGLEAKPALHIPEAQLLNGSAMDCKSCHGSTSSWGAMRMNHNNSMGGGAGWCKSCHASGTNYLGDMERKSLTHEARGKTPIDCSESGCHRPLGREGKTFVEWD